MPIDPEPEWKKRFNELPRDGGKAFEWAKNVADAADKGVTNKLVLSGIIGSVVFTWKKAIFQSLIIPVVPAINVLAPATQIANAWAAATTASLIVVPPGSSVGPPSPPTLFSVVTSSLIDAPSIAAGKSIIITMLTTSVPVKDGNDSIIGPALRKAFSLLTVSIIGMNSVPPPAGPTPLLSPFTPVQ